MGTRGIDLSKTYHQLMQEGRVGRINVAEVAMSTMTPPEFFMATGSGFVTRVDYNLATKELELVVFSDAFRPVPKGIEIPLYVSRIDGETKMVTYEEVVVGQRDASLSCPNCLSEYTRVTISSGGVLRPALTCKCVVESVPQVV